MSFTSSGARCSKPHPGAPAASLHQDGYSGGHQVHRGCMPVTDHTRSPVEEKICHVSCRGECGSLFDIFTGDEVATEAKLKRMRSFFHNPPILKGLRSSLSVRCVDPSSYPIDLQGCRGSQENCIGSFPPRFKGACAVSSDKDRISNLELVGHS